MKTRSKALLATLCAVVLVLGSVFATMAYLTSTDEVKNTFTVGKVAIQLDEAKANPDGTLVEGADRVQANEYKLMPGHTYAKDPMVTVKGDSEESYVRMLVTINKKSALDEIGFNALEVFDGYDASKWVAVSEKADGDNMVYEFRYHTTVSTVDAADKALEPLFSHVVVPGTLTNEQLATLEGLNIDVVAQAIQKDGFADADAAWAAFKA